MIEKCLGCGKGVTNGLFPATIIGILESLDGPLYVGDCCGDRSTGVLKEKFIEVLIGKRAVEKPSSLTADGEAEYLQFQSAINKIRGRFANRLKISTIDDMIFETLLDYARRHKIPLIEGGEEKRQELVNRIIEKIKERRPGLFTD